MVRASLCFDDEVKDRKEATGMTWEGLFMLGLETAEKTKTPEAGNGKTQENRP